MIDGVSNFRDFGGHATQRGGRMVMGRLFRSASPGTITAAGIEQLKREAIRTVVDLRGIEERRRATVAFDPARIVIRPVPVEPKTSAQLRAMLAAGNARAADVRDVMIRIYRTYVAEAAEAFGDAIHVLLAEDDGGGKLVHCTAGKDRTGFIVAVIQAALGASHEAILEDYLATNRHWDRASAVGHLPLDAAAIEPVLVADPDYLAAAFDEIGRRDGEPIDFIIRATRGRVTPAHLEAVIERG
jgi:protein-tyrosine phosphatase